MASLRTDWQVFEGSTNLDQGVISLESQHPLSKPASQEIDVTFLEPRKAFETFAGQRFEAGFNGTFVSRPSRSLRPLETPMDKFLRLRGET